MGYASAAVLLLTIFAPIESRAGFILQNVDGGQGQVRGLNPGQSFLAEDSNVSVGFAFRSMNPHAAIADITATLWEGEGVGGPILSTVTASLPPGDGTNETSIFFDFDFTSVNLVVGQSYTVTLMSDTVYWGIDDAGDEYSGGQAVYLGGLAPENDTRFRVIPLGMEPPPDNGPDPDPPSAPVPLPASALLWLGLAGWGATAVKRRRK